MHSATQNCSCYEVISIPSLQCKSRVFGLQSAPCVLPRRRAYVFSPCHIGVVMSSRAALISSAVSFLRDPSTAQSPLAQRIGFLESKGLTPQEIELALSQANGSHNSGISMTPYAQGGGPHGRMMAGGMMAREYERDWRDWFIMAVVGGSVGYVATKLAQVSARPCHVSFPFAAMTPPGRPSCRADRRRLRVTLV